MKIDYSKYGMTIKLDKIPRLLYINEEGNSCGQVYEKGVRLKPLNEVSIYAKTNEQKVNFLKYSVKVYDENLKTFKTIGPGNNLDLFSIKVSLIDTNIFQKILGLLKSIIDDENITEEVKKVVTDKLNKIMEGK